MRKPLITTILFALVVAGAPLSEEMDSGVTANVNLLQLAGAAEASISTPVRYTITDHYGDPARFVKYIIRRPPVLA